MFKSVHISNKNNVFTYRTAYLGRGQKKALSNQSMKIIIGFCVQGIIGLGIIRDRGSPIIIICIDLSQNQNHNHTIAAD